MYTEIMAKDMKTIPGGFIIFFEGIDGTGKTTQLKRTAEFLKSDGWLVETARAHGGTPIGEALRSVSLSNILRPPLTDLYISLAMHASLAEKVAEWRQTGAIILIDRSPLSMVAYQQYGDHLAPEIVEMAAAQAMSRFSAELCITYVATVDTAMERAKQKHTGNADHFESKGQMYFERVQQGYHAAAELYGCTVIDSTTASTDAVGDLTITAIRAAIKNRPH